MFDKRTTEQLGKLPEWRDFENSSTFLNVHELIEYAIEGRSEEEILQALIERTRNLRNLMERSSDKLATLAKCFEDLILGRSSDFPKVMEECQGLSGEDAILLTKYYSDFIARHIHRTMEFRHDIEKTEISLHDDLHVEIITPTFGSLPFSVDSKVILGVYRIIKEWVRLGRPENKVFQYYPLMKAESGEVENPKEVLKTFEKWDPEQREGENHVGLYYCSSNDCFMANAYVRSDDVFTSIIKGGVGRLFSINLIVTSNQRNDFEGGLFKGIKDVGFLLDSCGRPFSLDPFAPIKKGYREYPEGLTVKRFDERHEITLDVAASEVLANGKELFSALGISVYRLIGDKLFCIGAVSMDKSYPGSEGRILIEAEVNDFLPRYDYYKAEICPGDKDRLFIKVHEGYNRKE